MPLSEIRRTPGQTADQIANPLVWQVVDPNCLTAQKGFKRLSNEVRAPDLTFASLSVKPLEQWFVKPNRNLCLHKIFSCFEPNRLHVSQ